MARLDRVQVIERFRELAKLPITPHTEVGYIFWNKATGGIEMGGSHDNPEDLIKQLGMWRDSEVAASTVQRYEELLASQGLKSAGLDEEKPVRLIIPEGHEG